MPNSPNLSGLGNPIRHYERSRQSIVKVLIVSGICLLISVLVFSGAFAKNAGLDQKIVLSILAIVFLIPPGFGIYMLITRRGSAVTLHENGLVYKMGSKIFATTWDDIASLTESTASRIEKKNGEAFDLGQNVEGYGEIAQVLHDETFSRLLPPAREAIARGKAVTFKGLQAQGKVPMGGALPDELVGGGSLTVDSEGIASESDGAKLAWPEIVNFGVRPGEARRARFNFFFVEGGDRRFQVNYGALPNAHILLAICQEMTPHLREKSE